ncbi:phosphoribosyltransferase [Candidatus Micrarchaeota archaeon]|nr:phosphoribosyltransferase [Candidatus Micrarchaeota archaeon]
MFPNRYDAGKQLAQKLTKFRDNGAGNKTIVLAIPRGALQIGEVFHKELGLPLDIIITKKIPHPNNEELAIGAVGSIGGKSEFYIDEESSTGVLPQYINEQKTRLEKLIRERYLLYRAKRTFPKIKDKIIILVDDGIATGSTVIAAIKLLEKQKPKKIIVATPICGLRAAMIIRDLVDELITLEEPAEFYAIGQFYEDFPQVEDEEAIDILRKCSKNGIGNRKPI